jgi:hypothetical protein
MKKYRVVAFPDEEGNKKERATIEAENHEQAQAKAWRMFPEHHEVGVWEMEGGEEE